MTDSATSTIAPTIQELNGALLIPKPRKKPFRVSRERRERIEAAVDGLLQLLDAIDADPDLEPSMSALTELGVPSGAWDECEDNHDAEHEDGEPSLGWTATNKQLGWPWYGDTDEREDEHDGCEPDVDNEPNGDEGDFSVGIPAEEPYFPALRVRTFGVLENGVVTVAVREARP